MVTTPARPWWVWLATASFVAYFVFLHLSFVYERTPMGFATSLRPDGVHITSITPGSAAERDGFAAGDRIVSMNGLPIGDATDFTVGVANQRIGEPGEFVIERNGVTMTLATRPLPRRWIFPGVVYVVSLFAFGLSLGLGLLILWRGPADAATWLGGLLLCSLGCVFLPLLNGSIAVQWRNLPAPVAALMWPAAIGSTAAHLLLFWFCATASRAPLTRPQLTAISLPGMAITVYVVIFVALVIYAPPLAVRMPLPDWLNFAGPLTYPLYFFASAALVFAAARQAADATERRRAQTLLLGIVAAGAGMLIFALALGLERSGVDVEAGAMLLFAVPMFCVLPITFAYATLRHRLFDVRVIVRLGLQYALARGAIGAVVPVILIVLAADVALHRSETLESIVYERGFAYVAVLVVIYGVYSRRLEWMAALDRRFFRDRYAAQQILTAVVQDVGSSRDFDMAAHKVVGRIDAALHPVMVAVMAKTGGATAFAQVASSGAAVAPLPSNSPLPQIARAVGKPVSPGGLGVGEDVDLIVPIELDADRDEALLILGPRKSEEPYSHEDKELLAAIAASLRLLMGRSVPAQAPTVLATPARAPQLLANRYHVERPIGEGGMGVVYAAMDTTLQRRVAIKVIKDHLAGDALARFQREARTAASLSHPHIVTVHDFGTDETGSPFLVMELLEGQSLRTLIKAGPLPAARALAIMSGLASAIDAAHAKGVIHRDLKPENVFLISDTHAKILDYGIAKAAASHTTFATAGVVGTLAYMAPEQAAGGEASPAWDVWALTIIMFEMLTGRHPFNGGLPIGSAIPVKTLAPELSDELAAAVDGALSLSPDQRPSSATALLRALC